MKESNTSLRAQGRSSSLFRLAASRPTWRANVEYGDASKPISLVAVTLRRQRKEG